MGTSSSTDKPDINIDDYSEATGNQFEPRESVKGNIARAMFYFNTIFSDKGEPSFFDQQDEALCLWNRLDPFDSPELARSAAIAQKQGNENPFVLDPSLAERLYCTS